MNTILKRNQYKPALGFKSWFLGCSIKIKSVAKEEFMKGNTDVMTSEITLISSTPLNLSFDPASILS